MQVNIMKGREEEDGWGVGPVVPHVESPHSNHQELELDQGKRKISFSK